MGVRLIGISVATAALAAGCARDPVEQRCPAVGEDDLVVTEFRGQQSPDDGSPTWVELYNATTSSVDLEGTKVRFRKKDGSSEVDIIVRRSVTVAAGGYATLGLVPDDPSERPSFIDYGFVNDFHVGFLPAAAVDVEACGTRIDRATYESPTQLAEGVVHVFVNGTLAWTEQAATPVRNGRFLARARAS
jgi:hypothetical protein